MDWAAWFARGQGERYRAVMSQLICNADPASTRVNLIGDCISARVRQGRSVPHKGAIPAGAYTIQGMAQR